MSLGKLTHYGFDLVLISIILAGIHRNTGLAFDTAHFSSVDVRNWFGKYLAFGEICYDKTVSLLRVSGYFKQRNLVMDGLLDKGKSYLKAQTGRDLDDFTKK